MFCSVVMWDSLPGNPCPAECQRALPAARIDPDVLYVDHGDVATSAGAGAGIDLCLHLIRTDHGARYAADVARHMVLPPHREGGQLQYAAPPHPGWAGPGGAGRAEDRPTMPVSRHAMSRAAMNK